MGQQISDGRTPIKGGIYVQLPKSVFATGETISGVVHVNLEENYKGHILQVSLQGYEETQYDWCDRSPSQENSIMKNHHYKGFNMFLNYSTPIYDFSLGNNREGFQLSAGQWSIPFKIIVGHELPSSFNFVNQDQYANLVYRINATIIPTDLSVYPVQGIQEIAIRQQSNIQSQPIQPMFKSQIFAPRTNCLCPGGDDIQFLIELDKSTYCQGDIANVQISCDLSKFSGTLLSIQVSIAGILILQGSVKRWKKMFTLDSQKELKIEGKNLKESFQIQIPTGKCLTYKGGVIHQQHFLQIRPVADACCACFISPDRQFRDCVNVPITITSNNDSIKIDEGPPLLIAPQLLKWNSTMLQPTEFDSSQAFKVQTQQALYQEIENAKLKTYLLNHKWS